MDTLFTIESLLLLLLPDDTEKNIRVVAVVYSQAPCNVPQTGERKHGEIKRWSMGCLSISLSSEAAVQAADEFTLWQILGLYRTPKSLPTPRVAETVILS